jgi:hypothetical protein
MVNKCDNDNKVIKSNNDNNTNHKSNSIKRIRRNAVSNSYCS